MLVDELRELTNNSKQYQKEYEEIVRKLREIAANGFNEITIMDVSNVVRSKYKSLLDIVSSTLVSLTKYVTVIDYNKSGITKDYSLLI